MKLAWKDRMGGYWHVFEPKTRMASTFIHPPGTGEGRTEYCRRFFEDVKGLGNVIIGTLRGKRVKIRAYRGM